MVKTLKETLLIVVIIIFLIPGSAGSPYIQVVAIPLSILGALFLTQAFGFSIKLLALLTNVFFMGLVVEDGIVVVENVKRHLSEGQAPHVPSNLSPVQVCQG